MSDNTPQDDKAMAPASDGSVAGEPVAYQAVDEYGRPYGYAQIVLPYGKWPKSQRVPLYAQPQPTLTDAERKAIRFAAGEAAAIAEQNPASKFWPDHAACLRSAAERLG